jgi:hypothetical protein
MKNDITSEIVAKAIDEECDANDIMTEDEFFESCRPENHDIDISTVKFSEETSDRTCEEFDIANYMAS